MSQEPEDISTMDTDDVNTQGSHCFIQEGTGGLVPFDEIYLLSTQGYKFKTDTACPSKEVCYPQSLEIELVPKNIKQSLPGKIRGWTGPEP